MSLYRLAIVDDEPSIRRGLGLIGWSELGYEVAGLFSDGREAIEYIRSNDVDVVLTDIRMNHVSGIELAKWLNDERPEVLIVLLSGYSDFEYARSAIRYHALRYLLKPTDPDELIAVFRETRQILDERKAAKQMRQLLSRIKEEERQLLETESLTPDDKSVQRLIREEATQTNAVRLIERTEALLAREGFEKATQAQIAEQLNVSASHLSRIFRQYTGETFSTYLIRKRVARAKWLLAQTNTKIQDIGQSVGYWDVRHFIRVFSRHTGMTPSEYRRGRRE